MKIFFTSVITTLGIGAVCIIIFLPTVTGAENTPSTALGLQITPVRQLISIDAGTRYSATYVIANLTPAPTQVNLIGEQFSVQNYSYNYTFSRPSNDWLNLAETTILLSPGQSKTMHFSFNAPANATPGGYYYTILASTTLVSSGVTETIQAADLLYVTVRGKLSTVSHLESSTIPHVVFGKSIPYKLNAVNTGNVYSFIFVSGQLHGLLTSPPQTSSGRLLLPGKVRTLTANIDSPVLPGIYKATYGYKTEGNWTVQESRWIVYIPPWSVALFLAVLLIAGSYLRKHKHFK